MWCLSATPVLLLARGTAVSSSSNPRDSLFPLELLHVTPRQARTPAANYSRPPWYSAQLTSVQFSSFFFFFFFLFNMTCYRQQGRFLFLSPFRRRTPNQTELRIPPRDMLICFFFLSTISLFKRTG